MTGCCGTNFTHWATRDGTVHAHCRFVNKFHYSKSLISSLKIINWQFFFCYFHVKKSRDDVYSEWSRMVCTRAWWTVRHCRNSECLTAAGHSLLWGHWGKDRRRKRTHLHMTAVNTSSNNDPALTSETLHQRRSSKCTSRLQLKCVQQAKIVRLSGQFTPVSHSTL